ncbi:MAG: hypothetical protein L0G46_06215, partial [Kocuria sp.]|nr:hypothetical protein [Kocuria sp.]
QNPAYDWPVRHHRLRSAGFPPQHGGGTASSPLVEDAPSILARGAGRSALKRPAWFGVPETDVVDRRR